MKDVSFYIPYKSDERFLYCEKYLKQKFRIAKDEKKAEYILLPIPVKENMVKQFPDKKIFAGCVDFPCNEEKIADYGRDELFQLKNAYLTAEGAYMLAKENSKKAFFNSSVLICGFGRIAKALAALLFDSGAKVCICSRSEKSALESVVCGYKHITFNELPFENDFDFVFNTVPHPVLNSKELSCISPDCVVIELASFPGGIDLHSAESKGIKVVDGKALPKRYSPDSAGKIIAETVERMLGEGLI